MRSLTMSTLAVLCAVALSGCSTAFFTDGFGVLGSTATPTPSPSASQSTSSTPAPKPSVSANPPIQAWEECPRIVTDLNKNVDDPAQYAQIEATSFAIQDVGLDTLLDSCVIQVKTDGQTVTWAVTPGDATLAASIKGNLLDAGFSASGIANSFTSTASGQGAFVIAFDDGAGLDGFLASSTAFARIGESLVYVGIYTLS